MKKAIPYFDTILGRTIKPINPNAYKMEYYLADVLASTKKLGILVIPRSEFAPIKNPPGGRRRQAGGFAGEGRGAHRSGADGVSARVWSAV